MCLLLPLCSGIQFDFPLGRAPWKLHSLWEFIHTCMLLCGRQCFCGVIYPIWFSQSFIKLLELWGEGFDEDILLRMQCFQISHFLHIVRLASWICNAKILHVTNALDIMVRYGLVEPCLWFCIRYITLQIVSNHLNIFPHRNSNVTPKTYQGCSSRWWMNMLKIYPKL